MKEYIIYCDESIGKGRFYSNFYGGALICSKDFEKTVEILNRKKEEVNFFSEIKWNKVSENYLEKYKEIITTYFDLIKTGKIKIRIMFSQNAEVPTNLSRDNKANGFHLLYYQFVKNAFGLVYHLESPKEKTFLRLFFDKLPLNSLKNEIFKSYIYGLQAQPKFREAKLKIRYEDIAEVVSHNHVILQCMDIILGAIAFRLNDLHKEKPKGARVRGKKTIAKEKLYKHILSQIKRLDNHKNFNIGITTGVINKQDLWENPYRHWKFTPSEFVVDKSKYKKNPAYATLTSQVKPKTSL